VITVAEARARGIPLPSDDLVAQDIVDEWEAWLARRIGPLDGSRSETFYVGISTTDSKLSLRRFTDDVTLTDGGHSVADDQFRLVDNGAAVTHTYAAANQYWTGPYVTATYEPNDAAEVRRVLYQLLALAMDEHADGPYASETLGDYAYSKGSSASQAVATRATLVASLLPRRDAAGTLHSISRGAEADDPVINRSEPVA
jgi:hypothetical protein